MEQPQITLQELIAYIKENCIHGSLSESVHSEIEEKLKNHHLKFYLVFTVKM